MILTGILLGAFFIIVGFFLGFKCGYNKALKDHHILSGKDAVNFIKKMEDVDWRVE